MQRCVARNATWNRELVWLWRNLWNLPGTAATIPLSMLLCNLILCHFKKNCLQPVLQHSLNTADCFKNQTFSYISAHFPKQFDQETEDAYRRWASLKEFEIQFVLLTITMHQLQQGYVKFQENFCVTDVQNYTELYRAMYDVVTHCCSWDSDSEDILQALTGKKKGPYKKREDILWIGKYLKETWFIKKVRAHICSWNASCVILALDIPNWGPIHAYNGIYSNKGCSILCFV